MEMKEEWLMPGAVVPVDAETTAALVAEIKRLIGVVGGMALGMQPAQEPVAWGVPNTRPTERQPFMMLLHSTDGCQYPEQLVPLYTAPQQRKPLSDEQWQVIADTLDCLITRKQKDAIEAVIGIKE